MSTNHTRRHFLRTFPIAAAAGVAAADLMPAVILAEDAPLSQGQFQLITGQDMQNEIRRLAAQATPSVSKRLFNDRNFLLDLWVEKKNSGTEYEWHEQRDHVVEILEGETEYEVGGSPQGAHLKGPGEWLAPSVEGATKLRLKKGDSLIIRRGTAHRRITAESVTFTITAPVTPVKS